jgi:hypothetical protein
MTVLGVVALALSLSGRSLGEPDAGSADPASPSASIAATATATAPPSSTPPASPTPTPTATPTATPTPTPSPTEALEDAEARRRFVEFQQRLIADAAEVQASSQAMTDAAQAQDDPATVAAAVDVLDFVDRERDWLAAHPPAPCYATAHASAGAMLLAYAAVADAVLAYADATGLDRLEALAAVADRADAARVSLSQLQGAVGSATCPG